MGGGGYYLNQNLETLLKTLSNDGRFGLGYKPSIYDKIRLQKEKKKKRLAKLEMREFDPTVAQEASFEGNTVYACLPDFELNNWDIVDLPAFSRDFQDGDEDDVRISSELLRMVEEEDEVLGHHQELVEAINLGSQEESKELSGYARISVDIVVHRVPLKPKCNPVRQKLHKMKPDVLIKIKEEVHKQIEAEFLIVSKYPEWVANIVPVPKKDRKVRMCVDYKDLNRASPKDNFPFPHIDMLVDNTAGYLTFSFMDGFSRYNQIKIAEERKNDIHYPLGNILLQSNTFWATSGKLLGFIVSEEEIKVDLDKVRAIMEMSSPKTEKKFEEKWNEDCEESFNKIKQYLQSPPVLIPPAPRQPLILYLTVLESSMGGVLGQHDLSRKEHVIYYLSKNFTDYESRYSMLERTCCALVWTAHRLRQYMLYHTTCLISKMDPIKYIFEKPLLSGRIAKWQVLLSEYDIVYVIKKAIKGNAVADHLAAQPVADYEPMRIDFSDENIFLVEKNARDHETWTMLFDGASNELGHGIGVVLISPEGKVFPLTAKLCFECTHNIVEYEACDMSIKKLKVLGDSMSVIHQVKEE
ncbi:uncharacterized protein E6C27_scaffold264G00550 [Cucumis melo var. makuwa]|nr:uncharacterized protein E6C27_scaffold264G00550 [Cucumis melo var. makuwa]